ncbi:JmjC domain-containing protein [Uliginosibacterium sp. sgz301328]|uniref:JmjC domain-containing protein n=1 Tax=Uliginosibacterium sp. sgz301328 TaxID=3243764 RepID=UPI00359D79A9
MIEPLLGGITPRQFLAEYWQKKPLLVRQAVPGFTGLVSAEEVRELAADEDVESRLVSRDGHGRWQIARGPLGRRDIPRRGPWTVLVQGLNLVVPEADALLRRFNFLPYTRLDDLMVSHASDGGGVGPHFDSYDVFLLQGMGKRHWRISAQRDLSLVEDAPLKILRHFKPSQEWVLEPGDMLYLPPRYAHDGIAIGECQTYSIGFRAPSAQEIVTEFLAFLQEDVNEKGMYTDPDQAPVKHPAQIQTNMIGQVSDMLASIRWNDEKVARFIGRYMSEPKPHVYFDPLETPDSLARFVRKARQSGLSLDLRSQFLYRGKRLFMNGEESVVRHDSALLCQLADERKIGKIETAHDETWQLLHEWYCAGFVHLNVTAR